VGDLNKIVGNVSGVVNVIETRVFNKVWCEYSSAQVSIGYKNETTKEIIQSDSIIFMKSNQIFQIRFPNVDIRVRTKTLGTATY
jgi:hypothetical protein